MKVTPLKIAGLVVIEPRIFSDKRGFFLERYNEATFEKELIEYGIPKQFSQDNHSRSKPGVIRGMHLQLTPPQGKLVSIVSGAVLDFAVDIRPNSETFGQFEAVELSAQNAKQFWIPAGFAHGFAVLGDKPADMIYKVTSLYNAKSELGFKFNDPDVNLPWPKIDEETLVSDRDRDLPCLKDIKPLISKQFA